MGNAARYLILYALWERVPARQATIMLLHLSLCATSYMVLFRVSISGWVTGICPAFLLVRENGARSRDMGATRYARLLRYMR